MAFAFAAHGILHMHARRCCGSGGWRIQPTQLGEEGGRQNWAGRAVPPWLLAASPWHGLAGFDMKVGGESLQSDVY